MAHEGYWRDISVHHKFSLDFALSVIVPFNIVDEFYLFLQKVWRYRKCSQSSTILCFMNVLCIESFHNLGQIVIWMLSKLVLLKMSCYRMKKVPEKVLHNS